MKAQFYLTIALLLLLTAILSAVLRFRDTSSREAVEFQSAKASAPAPVRNTPARADASHAPQSIRDAPELSPALATYDYIEELKPTLTGNARRHMDAIQRVLFIGDYRCANMGEDCERAETAFLEVQNAPMRGAPEASDSTRKDLSTFKTLQKHQRVLLQRSRNPGYSNILETLQGAAPQTSPLQTQDFMDASLYVGLRASVHGVMQDELAHAAALNLNNAEFEKAVAKEVGELNDLLNAYRKVFERRLSAYDAATIDQLDRLQLTNAGTELQIPCPKAQGN